MIIIYAMFQTVTHILFPLFAANFFSVLLGSKSRNTKRKLTVLREIDDGDE